MTASNPNVATNSLTSCRHAGSLVLGGEEERRLLEHHVRDRDAEERTGHLRDEIDGHLPPREPALARVGERDRGIEVGPAHGPNVRIKATSPAPVAIVLARSAMATFPPARLSPMIPEPTTVARSIAVPTSSATARLRERRGSHGDSLRR